MEGNPERILNDIDGVIQMLPERLGAAARQRVRDRLVQIVRGATPGNRDRPLFDLAREAAAWLIHTGKPPKETGAWVFQLLVEGREGALLAVNSALLDFLLSMDDFSHAQAVQKAFALLTKNDNMDAVRDCANALARELYTYRTRYMPAERLRQHFADIRRFLATRVRKRPQDGDALAFWMEAGAHGRWTLYATVLDHMIAFDRALDIETAMYVPADPFVTTQETDKWSEIWETVEVEAETFAGTLARRLELALSRLQAVGLDVLLKKVELAQLEQLAQLGKYSISWPRSCACLLALAPHQARLVQNLRKGARKEKMAHLAKCCGGDDYAQVVADFATLADTLLDIVCLRYLLAPTKDAHEIPPKLSRKITSMNARNTPVLRRKGIKSFTRKDLVEKIAQVQDEILLLAGYLADVRRAWLAHFGGRTEELFEIDRNLFVAKLTTLYAPGSAKQEGG